MVWYERLEAAITRSMRPRYLDACLFLIAVTLGIQAIFTQDVAGGIHEPNALDVGLVIAANVPILFRRRHPLAALVACLAAVIVLIGSNGADGTVAVTVGFLTYSVGAYARLQRALAGLAAMVVALMVLGALDSPGLGPSGIARFTAIFALVWVVGVALGARREATARALRLADDRAELEAQRAARAVTEERLRIARELHDEVAHSISVIAVQTGVARHFLEQDVAQADAALDAIGQTARATLDELRRLLGALRDAEGKASHAPAPTLDDLPELVDQMRSVGLPVELTVRGRSNVDHRGVGTSAYRIIQEALTNVAKHAGPTERVRVNVEYADAALEVRVDDDGRGAGVPARVGPAGTGHGIVGMRERVEVWGGSLTAGPCAGGGFSVAATFPLGDAA